MTIQTALNENGTPRLPAAVAKMFTTKWVWFIKEDDNHGGYCIPMYARYFDSEDKAVRALANRRHRKG